MARLKVMARCTDAATTMNVQLVEDIAGTETVHAFITWVNNSTSVTKNTPWIPMVAAGAGALHTIEVKTFKTGTGNGEIRALAVEIGVMTQR